MRKLVLSLRKNKKQPAETDCSSITFSKDGIFIKSPSIKFDGEITSHQQNLG